MNEYFTALQKHKTDVQAGLKGFIMPLYTFTLVLTFLYSFFCLEFNNFEK